MPHGKPTSVHDVIYMLSSIATTCESTLATAYIAHHSPRENAANVQTLMEHKHNCVGSKCFHSADAGTRQACVLSMCDITLTQLTSHEGILNTGSKFANKVPEKLLPHLPETWGPHDLNQLCADIIKQVHSGASRTCLLGEQLVHGHNKLAYIMHLLWSTEHNTREAEEGS
eukprot:1148470-Pelagomonas_calceolata.AAC.1